MDCIASPFFFALYTAQEIINTHSQQSQQVYSWTYADKNRVVSRTHIWLHIRRNKMGRPVRKDRFGSTAGDFEVTGAFATGTVQPDGTGAEAVSTVSGNYIEAQRSSTRFKVNFTSADGSTRLSQILDLTPVAPGSLANGQFCLQIILDDSTVAYASKIFNNTVHYKEAGGTTGSVKYSLLAEGTDEGKNAGVGSMDTI